MDFGGVCVMSLPDWLPGPIYVPGPVFLLGGLCLGGLCLGVSVWLFVCGVSV